MQLSIITVAKNGLSSDIGSLRRVLEVFERHNLNVEYTPSGIDSVSLVVQSGKAASCLYSILGELQNTAHKFGIINEGTLARVITQEDLISQQRAVRLRVDDVDRAKAALAAAGVQVLDEVTEQRSLEDFYFSLVGGNKGGNAQ